MRLPSASYPGTFLFCLSCMDFSCLLSVNVSEMNQEQIWAQCQLLPISFWYRNRCSSLAYLKFASIVNSFLVYRKSPTAEVPAFCREDENKTQLHVLLVSLFSFGSFISVFFFVLDYSFLFFASKEEFCFVWVLDRHRVTYKDSIKDGHSR